MTAAQLPELLGLESAQPQASVEIIYGDRLAKDSLLVNSADWSDLADTAPPKGTP
jgi:hypothetical protein